LVKLEAFSTSDGRPNYARRIKSNYALQQISSDMSYTINYSHLTALLIGRPMLVGKVWISFTHEHYFSFYQSTVLSSRAVDGHHMYFRGSIIGKASTVGIETSPTLS